MTDPAPDPEIPTEGPDDDTRPPVVLPPSPTRQPMPPMPQPPPDPVMAVLDVATEENDEGIAL
ncbi:hypothetical protein [Amycolatopsis sp. NPDC051071]|uniref:hypothetical protein n=1 Tax=Amycolatopsis sp. NPDC051071 TaxID=3154637 RepID=UPI00342A6A9B